MTVTVRTWPVIVSREVTGVGIHVEVGDADVEVGVVVGDGVVAVVGSAAEVCRPSVGTQKPDLMICKHPKIFEPWNSIQRGYSTHVME